MRWVVVPKNMAAMVEEGLKNMAMMEEVMAVGVMEEDNKTMEDLMKLNMHTVENNKMLNMLMI